MRSKIQIGVLALMLVAGCDDGGGDDGTAETGGADSGMADGGSDGDDSGGADGGGMVAAGEISVTGTLDGEAFTLDCTMQRMALFSLNGQFNWLCQMGGQNATITGSIFQMNIQGTTFMPGAQTLDGDFGGSISVSRAGDFKTFATTLAESGGLTVTLESADETSFVGTATGSWVQEGITVELDAAFDFPVDVS